MKILRMVAIVLLASLGCSEPSSNRELNQPNIEEFQIGADRIETPDSVGSNEDFVVAIYGNIGHNSKYSFERMEFVDTKSKMEMTAFGTVDNSPQKSFAQAFVNWNGREFIKKPPHVGPVKIVFNQPDGTTIEQTVEVTSN